ncbi:hypothetical protein ABIC65_001066 [Sphingomonas trueperi]|uniref:hypothetical protein n=1 Tax=Sphingomonas trueperi TaxID=53317 RepID=UPI003392E7DD
MNAPARIVPDGFIVPFPADLQVAEEWTEAECAHRAAITIHLPNEDEWSMRCRVAIAMMRDRATAGLRRCSDAAYPLLSYVAREATTAVYAPVPPRQLVLLRAGLTQALEAARIMERASR